MPAEVSALGLVLRRSDSGESDRRLFVLTEEFGKLELIAKGARKGGSRLAGASEPVSLSRFGWAAGRHRRFVNSVQPQTSYPGLRSDYDRLCIGLAVCELLDASLPIESPCPGALLLAAKGLGTLEHHAHPEAVFAWLLSKLMDEEGQRPDWTACAVTGKGLDGDPAWVSSIAGGYVCEDEAGAFPDRWLVSATTLIVLRKLGEVESPPPALRNVTESLECLVRFWSGNLERKLPACRTVVENLKSKPCNNQEQ